MGRRDELFVTAFRLAEHLDDLDAADVFHRRVVESLCGGHPARVVFAVARHHQHEKEHAQRQRGQRGQRHAPVKTEQINERGCTSPSGMRESFSSPCLRILPSTAKAARCDCEVDSE